MAETLKLTRTRAALVALGLSTAALTGCGNTETTEPMVVGVTCPEDTVVDVERIENPQRAGINTANIFLTCGGEAPVSMQLINDGQAEVADNTEDQTKVEIVADYYGGGFLQGSESPALSIDSAPEEDKAQIVVSDIDKITRVEVVG